MLSAAIASDGTHLWVADTSSSASHVGALYEMVAGKLLAVESPLLTTPRLLTASSTGVYTLNASNVVAVTNPATLLTTSLSDPSIVNPVALVAAGNFLWVLNAPATTNAPGSITGFDLTKGQVTQIKNKAFSAPIQMAATSSALWVLNQDGSLERVDLTTQHVTSFDVGVGTITHMASDPADLYLTIMNGATTSLVSVDASSQVVTTYASALLNDVTSLSVTPTTVWVGASSGGPFNDGSLVSFDRVSTNFAAEGDPALFNPVAVAAVGTTPWFLGKDSVGVMVLGAVTSPTSVTFTQGLRPPRVPSTSLAPWPNPMNGACQLNSLRSSFVVTTACTNEQLQGIDVAHELEHVRPMTLPTNWSALSNAEQLFVLADLERVDRKLPPFLGLNKALSTEARSALRRGGDPSVAPGFALSVNTKTGYVAFGGTWSENFSPLSADYLWMYNDGWAGTLTANVACTSVRAAPCWAHRNELLGLAAKVRLAVGLTCRTCEMGAGGYTYQSGAHWYTSYVDLVERPAGAPPTMYFTWAKDVVPYLS